MSGAEHEQPQQRSRVKIGETAKRDPQIEVSVVEGTPEEELERIRKLAVKAFRDTVADVAAPVLPVTAP